MRRRKGSITFVRMALPSPVSMVSSYVSSSSWRSVSSVVSAIIFPYSVSGRVKDDPAMVTIPIAARTDISVSSK